VYKQVKGGLNNMENEETKQEIKTPTMVSDALKAAESLKEQNQKMQENIKKLEELKAYDTLGGVSDGGVVVEQKKQLSDEEYAIKALQGDIEALE
jgi:hypothetical protein